ncbi:hypothetical protein PZ938_16970 [Luteipulveratus sp. YIM 133132]|uniref:hypothetical protein n=1 Tax=Luteipulveratus flavus TaxID=3031728 RepID=UPI0023B13BD4|nr:hypothetical protein [Luteipulveratus sp. YIM 133132]MDE9367315.1 hypothetical protein [Luteipulveratus sp. YIM 133132]
MARNEVERIAGIADPVKRLRAATEGVSAAQRTMTELARMRRSLVQELHADGWSYAKIADAAGLSRGRVHQVRHQGPAPEGALFGAGPITLAVPVRKVGDRAGGVVAVEDATAAERMGELLTSLTLDVEPFHIPVGGQWDPPPDAIAICGPKSSPVTAEAVGADPLVTFSADGATWVLKDRASGALFQSPWDNGDATRDLAYVGRVPYRGHRLFVIAGVHASGSLGAVDHLARHLPEIYNAVGTDSFSMVIGARFDGTKVIETETMWGPRKHA